MTEEKWEQIVEMVKKNYPNATLRVEDLVMDTSEGEVVNGTEDVLAFTNSIGENFEIVRENKPAVLEKKELYSTRAGQAAQTQYKFSDTEMSHKLRVYKETEDGEWKEITLDKVF